MYNKKVLSTAKAELNKAKAPKKPKDMITDRMGQWKYPGLDTRIPGDGSKDINITMDGVYKPLLAIADTGEKKKLYPGDNHTFRGAKYVDEFPEAKRGGNKKRKTKSLSGTNKLMQKNPLLRDYKNREFDPNVDYFQEGGDINLELTQDEIDQYVKGGYIVEDISVPELNQAQKGKTVEISDPKEFAYRNQKYKDSLDLYNYSNKQVVDKTKRFGSDAIGVQKEYNKKKAAEFLKEQLKTYGDLAHDPKDKYGKLITKLVKKSNISPIGLSINVEDYDYIFKKPAQKVVLKKENTPVQDTIIQKPVVQQEVKPVIQQNIKPVQKTDYPQGYQPYSLYGRVLDPEVYGYGESINGKPLELAQGADMMLKKMQMEKYKKANKYPWVKQEGGNIKTHRSKDGTVTNTITKANGDTVIQVKTKNGKYYEKLIKKSDALDTLSKLQGAVKPEFLALGKAEAETKREEKQAKQKFLKEAWSNYDDWSTSDKVSDRVGAFLNDPFGMTARALTGDQAYIPGMAQGLHNHEDPEVRNRYLKELGYTPGEFDASDVQNMINPGYWASSFVENSRKGNVGTAALEGALMFLPHLPKGTVSKSNIKSGAKLLADDIVNKTPLKNTYKILGKDTKFYNPGEKPHWLKGYTESWNPMEADLEPLADFRLNEAIKNLENKKIFKEHDAVNNKYSQILNNLSEQKKIALKANNTKAVSEINAELDDLFNARLKEHNKIARKHFQSKEHPFEEQIGAGGFGTVYGLPESEFVIKVGQVPKNESILKLVENSKGINKPNIALPKRASATSSGEKVIVMNKVEPVEGNIFTNPPTKESYEQLIKDVEELQGKGIYLDFENPQNIQYNPKTGLFNIYDLNTTGHILHKTVPKNSYNAGEKTIEQLLIDNKKLPSDWGSIASSKSNAANEWETTISNLTRPVGEIPYKPEFNTNAASKLYSLTHERKLLFDTPEGEKRIKDLIENTPELKNSGFTVDDYKRGLDDITNVNLHYHRLYKDYTDLEKALEYAKNVGGADKQAILDMNTQLGKMSFTLADYEKFIHEPKWYLNAYMNRKGQPSVGLIKPGIHPKDNFDIFANPHLNDLDILRIGRHELGHYIQRGARTNLDDELSKISLLDENPNIKHIPFSESQGSSKLHQLIMSAEDPFKKMKKYWKSAANGREKTPFIEEVRADLLEEGVINNLYDEVTPDMLEYHYINYLKKQGNKYPLRIFDLMENKPENFKIMSDVINKMPAVAPIVGGAGAAAIMGNEQGQKKEMKKGGIVADLTEKEIREYTARGYIVEEDDDEYQDGGEAEAISNIRRRQKEIADLRANSNMSEEVNQTPTQVPVQKTIVINKEPIKPLVRIAVSNKQIEKPKSTVVNKPIVKTFEKSKVKAEQKLNQKQIIQQVQAIKKDLKASYLPNAPKEFYNQFVEKPVTKHVQTPKALHSDNKTYADELKRMMRAIEEDDMMALVSGTEPKPKPLFENSNIEKEILDRQKFDNTHYGRFDTRGDDVMNRTDVKRNRDSELFFANMAKNNSVIVDIGSALGNNNPSMAGVSVWELASNPQIKKKGINVIATDLPDQIKDFKKHVKNKKAYPIDYAEVPETFNTPIADILKSKKLDDKKDVYLRAANSIDLLMNTEQAIEHLNHIAKTLKNKNVTYLYNNVILFKPEGSKTFKKLGNLNNAGFDHNNRTWVKNKNRIPYTLNF